MIDIVDLASATDGELLTIGAVAWITSVIAFAFWYWHLDRGGPAARARGVSTVSPAFRFPEDELAELKKRYPAIKGPADVQKAWDYAAAGGRVNQGRVIVEGFIDFDYEITQLTVRACDASGAVQTYFCDPIGHVQVSGDYVESWQPQAMSPAALARSREIAGAVTANLGGRGLFGVELFVKGDEVWFSEVSPRPHDTGLVTLCSQRFSEFELHARAILGLPVDVSLREPGASAVIYGGMEAAGIAFEGVAEALTVPRSDIRLFGKPEAFTRRRMGVAVANGADVDEARARAKLAAGKVRPVQG